MRENMHTQTKRVVGELRAHIDCSCGTQVQSTRAFRATSLSSTTVSTPGGLRSNSLQPRMVHGLSHTAQSGRTDGRIRLHR